MMDIYRLNGIGISPAVFEADFPFPQVEKIRFTPSIPVREPVLLRQELPVPTVIPQNRFETTTRTPGKITAAVGEPQVDRRIPPNAYKTFVTPDPVTAVKPAPGPKKNPRKKPVTPAVTPLVSSPVEDPIQSPKRKAPSRQIPAVQPATSREQTATPQRVRTMRQAPATPPVQPRKREAAIDITRKEPPGDHPAQPPVKKKFSAGGVFALLAGGIVLTAILTGGSGNADKKQARQKEEGLGKPSPSTTPRARSKKHKVTGSI